MWSRSVHARQIHQTAPYTWLDRYPELFDLAARLAPDARRILSFGCSTGEELVSLRRRFPEAEIVGAEINPRIARRSARSLTAADPRMDVIPPNGSRARSTSFSLFRCSSATRAGSPRKWRPGISPSAIRSLASTRRSAVSQAAFDREGCCASTMRSIESRTVPPSGRFDPVDEFSGDGPDLARSGWPPPRRRESQRRFSGRSRRAIFGPGDWRDAGRSSAPILQSGRDRGERFKDEGAPSSSGCGMVDRRERNLPPLHSAMSRSRTRGPQRRPGGGRTRARCLQPPQHVERLQVAFDQRDRIGEIPAGGPMGRVEDDRRGVEQAEFLIEPGDRGLDHGRRTAVAAVRAVRPDRDGVELGHGRACHCERSEAIQVSFHTRHEGAKVSHSSSCSS